MANYINRIQIKGVVGSVKITCSDDGVQTAVFRVAVDDNFFEPGHQEPVRETTWFNVRFRGRVGGEIEKQIAETQKGDFISAGGKMRCFKYKDWSGTDRLQWLLEGDIFGLEFRKRR